MKFRFFNFLAYVGATAALCLQSSSAEAIFASVKSTGMAAACISYPLDSLVGAYNPAGMIDIGDRFDIEAAWVRDTGRAKVQDNRSPFAPLVNGSFNGMRTKDIYPAGFGFNKVFCPCGWEFSAGLVLYNRNYQKTTYTKPFVLLGKSNLGLEYLHETLAPCFAVKFLERHSLGLSINYNVERVKVNGIENFNHPALPPPLPQGSVAPGHVTNRGYNYATGWGVTVGYRGEFFDGLFVGVTYQPETAMTRLTKYKGFLADRGRLNIPRKIGAGISYRIIPCLIVAFDVEHIQWSKIRALHNPLLHHSLVAPLGSKHGPGFGFRDQWYYRVGADWQITECISTRIGFRHANTPVRRSQTAVNLLTLDTVENFLTLGATYCLNCRHEFSFLFAYGFQKKVKGHDSIPAAFGGGEADLKEEKFALGLAYGWKF